jgi:tetratricopeptide (TPR) repeat protein
MTQLKTIIGVVVCLLLAFQAGTNGLARWYAAEAVANNDFKVAESAVQLSPSDAETRVARANVFLKNGQFVDAAIEFENATVLRPSDYKLWLELSAARERSGATNEAIAGLREAVRRAPFYAMPRWKLGQLLLQAGRHDEAFAEIRLAVVSDTSLLPAAMELAWQAFDGDATKVSQALQPQTDTARIEMAGFFVRCKKFAEAMTLFRSASGATKQDRKELLIELLEAKRFLEGYEVWASLHDTKINGFAKINDSDFESDVDFNEPGFGWHLLQEAKGASFTLDTSQFFSGKQSLRIDLQGLSGEAPAFISQSILVKPNTKYQLTFAASTKDLFTMSGLPVMTVTEAASGNYDLAGSEPLSQGTSKWKTYSAFFVTTRDVTAVVIALRRQHCKEMDCLIRGTIWLDNFELKQP